LIDNGVRLFALLRVWFPLFLSSVHVDCDQGAVLTALVVNIGVGEFGDVALNVRFLFQAALLTLELHLFFGACHKNKHVGVLPGFDLAGKVFDVLAVYYDRGDAIHQEDGWQRDERDKDQGAERGSYA
jgi:hypothetical protein